MLDIVFCSGNKYLMDRSIKLINKLLINYKFDYYIYKFMCNNSKLIDIINDNKRKIYVIDSDMLDVVNIIRKNDFISIIIIISSQDKIDTSILHKCLLILDYICFDKDYNDNLIKDINMGLTMMFKNDIFSFKYNRIVYLLSYESINYIEKESNVKRCIIHTLDNRYYVVNSIERIVNDLNGMFIKSSQSCIINIMNVKYIDCTNNIICFKNGDMTDLVTDKIKKIIKEYVK